MLRQGGPIITYMKIPTFNRKSGEKAGFGIFLKKIGNPANPPLF